jgi:hypothetical protein
MAADIAIAPCAGGALCTPSAVHARAVHAKRCARALGVQAGLPPETGALDPQKAPETVVPVCWKAAWAAEPAGTLSGAFSAGAACLSRDKSFTNKISCSKIADRSLCEGHKQGRGQGEQADHHWEGGCRRYDVDISSRDRETLDPISLRSERLVLRAAQHALRVPFWSGIPTKVLTPPVPRMYNCTCNRAHRQSHQRLLRAGDLISGCFAPRALLPRLAWPGSQP